jgi:hypothetical protein
MKECRALFLLTQSSLGHRKQKSHLHFTSDYANLVSDGKMLGYALSSPDSEPRERLKRGLFSKGTKNDEKQRRPNANSVS